MLLTCLIDGLPGAACPADPLSHWQACLPHASWPVVVSPSLQSPSRPLFDKQQADRCRLGAPEAQERQRGRGRGGHGPAPASFAP